MRKNKERDMTPFAMDEKPKPQNPLLLPLVWGASWIMTRSGGLRVRRIGMEGLRPPYLVLSEHQGFTDYYIAPLALFPNRANYVSDMEGFANYGKWLYGSIGCIPTRRYARSSYLVRNIRHVVEHNKNIVVIYPEARHSNVGTNSRLPPSTGKLIRRLGIPVVVLKTHGSYLTAPIWDESHRRKVPLSATLELVLTPEQISWHSDKALTDLINQKFTYDEYRWQAEQNISIPYARRAEGFHKVLYLCPACKTEHRMGSRGAALFCQNCEKRWEMDEYGRLAAENGQTEFTHIPDWYEWQRKQVQLQVRADYYSLDASVTIEALPNEKGFVPMGKGRVTHKRDGFRLYFSDTGSTLFFSTRQLFSVHTEYDYKGGGDCLVLSTKDCCYYLYPAAGDWNNTKIQFAAEYFHDLSNER